MITLAQSIADVSLAQTLPPWWTYYIPALAFAFCFGACVGSFINVVIFRLPAGISIISPPSRCPTCGARLTWRENLPIFGWLLLRGRCKYCDVRISPQYMIIELFMAVLFLGVVWLTYVPTPASPWECTWFGPWWHRNGVWSLPALCALLVLLAALTAMTIIDARTFTIPIEIPVVATVVAFAGWLVQGLLPARISAAQPWPIPLIDSTWFFIAYGGAIGLLISFILLRRGIFRPSFHDYDKYVKGDDPLADYPHGRREMLVELLYLTPCVVLATAGGLIARALGPADLPYVLEAVGASLLGYLIGGGVVWTIRILGTFLFGREAMGLGDVHLLAAVGAVLGWRDPLLAFFAAAFVGLGWWVLSMPLKLVFKKLRRELPYGPHLAVATLLVLLLQSPPFASTWSLLMQYLHPILPCP
jgi:leader peptidase (prepilin peptidase)/N-methyltransferase